MMTSKIQSLQAQADSLLNSGKMAEALSLFTQITEIDPENTDAWMMQAAIFGESGRLDEAVECCQTTIRLDPGDGDAHVMLGRLFAMQGKSIDALNCLEKVVKQAPDYGEAWNVLSEVYLVQGKFVEAEQSCRQAIHWLPGHAESYLHLANSLLSQGRREEAVAAQATAVDLEPSNPTIWYSSGLILEKVNKWEAAQEAYRRSVELAPELSNARAGLARIYCLLGEVATAQKLLSQAIEEYPEDTTLLCSMGAMYDSNSEPVQAELYYRRALRVASRLVVAWVGLGNALQNQDRHSEADQCYMNAIEIDPNHPEAHFNQGVSFQRQRNYDKALSSLNLAISKRPDFVEAHWYKSFLCLLLGDYALGWDEYEWRLRQKENITRPFVQPVWDGSKLDGRTILVHDEQGYGDTFQFVRYLALVKSQGAHVVFECHPKLSAILKGVSGYDQIVERVSPHTIPSVKFDTQIHLMSLPRIFNTRIEKVPDSIPYLRAESERILFWRDRIAADSNFKVGLAWSSANSIRSCSLLNFLPLSEVPGVSFYCLQKGPGIEQADMPLGKMDLIRLDKELDLTDRFVDTAALMVNLDLIISIDTSIVHLAGAMGCPVWTILSAFPDWRWTNAGNSTPWYPTMRLFRQFEPGDWDKVFAMVREELSNQVRERSGKISSM